MKILIKDKNKGITNYSYDFLLEKIGKGKRPNMCIKTKERTYYFPLKLNKKDRTQLGVKWNGKNYVLPFCL